MKLATALRTTAKGMNWLTSTLLISLFTSDNILSCSEQENLP